jgi:hypothetical protein
MARLIFLASDVRRVVEHSLNAPRQRKTWDKPVTEPSVLLVHDQGVYLMSNGEPRDILKGTTSFAAYAEGCHPEKNAHWYDTARTLVGGDDFGECLPWAKEIKAKLDAGLQYIAFEITPTNLELL